MLIVMKFGGATLKGLGFDGMRRLMSKASPDAEIAVVVSAPTEVTDSLEEAATRARTGDERFVKKTIEDLRHFHSDLMMRSLGRESTGVLTVLEQNLTELERALYGVIYLGELTPRSLDHVLSFGETIACKAGAHILSELGVRAVGLTGREVGIVTDEEFGNARPLMNLTEIRAASTLRPLLETGTVPVVGGFCGVTQDGHITTLGRGGSDYTATILASALRADEVWIWTDTDGIMTADPMIVPQAVTVPQLTYREAMELSLLGGKFMHPRTLVPAAPLGIRVVLKNAFAPDKPGTVIAHSAQLPGRVVKAVPIIRDVVMFTLIGPSVSARAGAAGRIFQSLGKAGAEAVMIAQSASETNVSIVVKKDLAERAYTTLELDLLGKVLDELRMDEDVCAVAVVGEGMRGAPGVAAKVFDAVAKSGINVKMIAASSEINISFLVSAADVDRTVRVVHEAFGLHEISQAP